MDLGLRDKVFVVTGGSRGLGFATARELIADGARVVLAARSGESLDKARTELGSGAVETVAADLADPDTPGLLVERARTAYGRLDGALVSVGGPPPGAVMDVDDDAWRAEFESVFLGGVRMMRAVARQLVEQGDGGAIAAVLSTSVKSPVSGLAVSNGLRPGLAMLVKNLADEVGGAGVRVNGLLPGRIDTERVRQLDDATGDAEDARRRQLGTIPLGRYGEAAEFGRVATFLLSPAASYLTGIMVPVDGGLTR